MSVLKSMVQPFTCVLGLWVGHLHSRCALGEGVEHGQPSVSQRRRGGVHDCVGTGVHHVTRHWRWHRRRDDGCWETHGCCRREIEAEQRHWGHEACSYCGQQVALHINQLHFLFLSTANKKNFLSQLFSDSRTLLLTSDNTCILLTTTTCKGWTICFNVHAITQTLM